MNVRTVLLAGVTTSKEMARARNRAYAKISYARVREKVLERSRRWRAANPERERERKRLWREANRERIRAYDRAYFAGNEGRRAYLLEKTRAKRVRTA